MKSKIQKKNYDKCACCGRRFGVDPRVGRLHRFCARPACAKASHVAAQKKWLRREKLWTNPDNVDVIRMQQWRIDHPGYWRRKIRVGRYELRGKLADPPHCIQHQRSSRIHRRLRTKLLPFARMESSTTYSFPFGSKRLSHAPAGICSERECVFPSVSNS